MASTTKTVNLELSQFVGTDKPAWLTDYNGDMQKIDDGYKKLEDANTATQADLDATKQDLSGSQTDIDGVKANVQALEAQDIALSNRLTVVEGNYDTMHHEVAINQQKIAEMEPYAMISSNKKSSFSFRTADSCAIDFDTVNKVSLLDVIKENMLNRIAVRLTENGYNSLFMQRLNLDGTPVVSSELRVNSNHAVHFELVNDEKVAIHFTFEDKEKFITIEFDKTTGIKMFLNDHGSVTELFHIPVPVTP